MPPTKKQSQSASKRRATALIQKTSIQQAGSMLDQLPEKPKESWSLREAIGTLQGTITTALERGYSYEEIAQLLTSKGVKISPSSLKSYLTATRKETGTAKVTKAGRGRKSIKAPNGAVPVATAEVAEPTDENLAPRRRGPRPRAAASTNGSKPTTNRGRGKSTTATKAAEMPKTSTRGRQKNTES